MNKAITIGLIGLLVFFGLQGQQDKVDEPTQIVEQQVVDYLNFTGTITEVRKDDNMAILVQDGDNENNSIVFNISNDVLLLDDSTQDILHKNEFLTGQNVTAYYPENTPMALSLPPIMTPTVIIMNSREEVGFVHVGTFDETLTSSDSQLKLNLADGMEIVDRQGNPVTELGNKTLVVFYTFSTRSIPAQTTPRKVIVL